MINSRIALSLASIAAAGALVAGATFAFFSDQATSDDNTFSTGNASLLITDDVIPGNPVLPYTESISGVSVSDMIPGQVETKDFWLKNDSAGSFSMDVTADLGGLAGTTPGDLPTTLLVKFTCDTDNNGLGDGADTTTVEKSVQAWVDDSPVALGTIGSNDGPSDATTDSDQDELICKMTATLPTSAEDDLAGKDLSFDGLFDATQVAP